MKVAIASVLFLVCSSAMATSLIPKKMYGCGALKHASGPDLIAPLTYQVMISAAPRLNALVTVPSRSTDVLDREFIRLGEPVSKKGKTAVYVAGDIEVTIVSKDNELDSKKISIAKVSNKDWKSTCKLIKP